MESPGKGSNIVSVTVLALYMYSFVSSSKQRARETGLQEGKWIAQDGPASQGQTWVQG